LNLYGFAEILGRTVDELADVMTPSELVSWEHIKAEQLKRKGRL